MTLRPGGSPSPNPEQQQSQQQYQTQPYQSLGQPSPYQQNPINYSTRFSSANFPQGPPVEAGSGQSPVSASNSTPNPFADHGSRSRSSTVGGQSQHRPNDSAGATPLQPQHSGYVTATSSRPVSRSTAASPPNAIPGAAQSRPSTGRSPFSTPISAPPRQRPAQILLINPNSTRSMTDACLASVRPNLPANVELTGYTAPYPAPTAIESATDAIMSTEAVLRDLAKYAAPNNETVQNFDGMLVACYSAHPLIDALRESYDVPVIGIMEASLYVARMLGGRFGIVATGARSKFRQEDSVAAYGLTHFYVGSEATGLGVLELESRDRSEVLKRVAHAARVLAAKGADTILLGCAGMTDMVRAAKDGVREEDGTRKVNVVDGVEAGVQVLSALVGMAIPTSKKWIYKGERDGRRARGQNWL
ncbi:uncharacterized protein HMPREF1541_09078 [Cyphellophora europaea CBS 101466]|uniref:Asp/Glu/hydantoin racemase n=1 Tax=Cyphellophora europaea (strain CBS 101466) TaxID=1220924 RepID=W2RKD6_CYPE1|nr:uncharacterized protein HMPREF1541_09078 [Cyphellophora europaea CBS 101466]ETN36800.1 hypothetical protein HMPREF1541_09078 [Cyphellophora europaea CBS 101466]